LAAQPAWPDGIQTQAEAENVGKPQSDSLDSRSRKRPSDLFDLIPGGSLIQQSQLFEAARAAGINQKYARQFLGVLIAEKRILIQKIPRSKAKSALGYVRTSSPMS
jgi:hypothetical protein